MELAMTLIISFAVGSLPLGYLLIRAFSAQDVRRLQAYNVGVPTLIERAGPIAFGVPLLDALKGAAAVMAAGLLWPTAAGWAVPAVVLGHLYAPTFRWVAPDGRAPRSRGAAVTLGSLAGLAAAVVGPIHIPAAALLVWGATIALPRLIVGQWGYPSLANVLAAAAALLAAYAVSPALTLPLAVMALLVIWRHKENVGRMADGIELRWGQRRPLPDDPDEVSCAFIIQPQQVEDLWEPPRFSLLRFLYNRRIVSDRLLRRLTLLVRPMKVDEYKGIETTDGRRVIVHLLGAPLFPDQILENPELAVKRARQGALLAQDLGARVLGLGAYWSVVGDKGNEVQAGMELPITNGGAYTAGTVKLGVERALRVLEHRGLKRRDITAAVVGANGVVGFGICRNVADRVGRLIMVGRDQERVAKSAALVDRRYANTEVIATTDYSLLPQADIIFTATSAPAYVIFPEHVKPGAVVYDMGRPVDVSPRVQAEVPGVRVIPGGVVRPPGRYYGTVDVKFGEGQIPACMAETIILALTAEYEHRSLGSTTRTRAIDYFVEQADRLGFTVVDGSELAGEASEA